jgi:erythromycin esterase-like protein
MHEKERTRRTKQKHRCANTYGSRSSAQRETAALVAKILKEAQRKIEKNLAIKKKRERGTTSNQKTG